MGADSYAFVHRTFLEYFCAADFVQQFNVAKTLDIEGLIALFDQHCCDDEWREVLRLISGQIDESFVGRIVDRLATRTDIEKWDRETPLPELPLAIECLSELRNPSQRSNEGASLIHKVVRSASRGLISENLLRTAMDLGERWPGKNAILTYRDASGRNSEIFPQPWSWEAAVFWALFIAFVTGDRYWITSLVLNAFAGYRAGALQALAEKWPDQSTRDLLAQRAVEGPDISERGAACSALAKMHSEFGRILPSRDLDGIRPYLDPREPIPREHIENAAVEAGIRRDDIDAQLASLSAHLGWDVMGGTKTSAVKRTGRSKLGHKRRS